MGPADHHLPRHRRRRLPRAQARPGRREPWHHTDSRDMDRGQPGLAAGAAGAGRNARSGSAPGVFAECGAEARRCSRRERADVPPPSGSGRLPASVRRLFRHRARRDRRSRRRRHRLGRRRHDPAVLHQAAHRGRVVDSAETGRPAPRTVAGPFGAAARPPRRRHCPVPLDRRGAPRDSGHLQWSSPPQHDQSLDPAARSTR
jgi:hypothetical protein